MKPEKKSLTFEQILSADDNSLIEFPVPEWGGIVYLRALSAKEAGDFNKAMSDPARRHDHTVRLVAESLYDEDGARIVPKDNSTALEQFRTRNWGVFQRIAKECLKLNGVLNEEDAKKAVEEVKKA